MVNSWDVSLKASGLCPISAPVVRQLEPGEEGVWDQFVRSSPFGTFFHLSGWRKIVEGTLGHRCIPLVATRDGQISGVFPIAQVRNIVIGDCLVSTPLSVYGGICANDSDSHSVLLREGGELAARMGVKYLEMRNRYEPFPVSLPGRDLYVTFTQDLTAGPEKLLQGLPRDTRYAVRKSQKAGLEWVEDIDTREFYEIYAHSVHRLGTPVFPLKLFTRFREVFGRDVRVFGVVKGKTVIAGVMSFYFKDIILPYYGGCLDGYQKDSPNNFMYWSLIAQSAKEGLREFDFGRSKRGTGSFRFKAAWSMVETDLPYRYHLIRAKDVPHLSPIDRKFQLPIAVWQRMPFGWTKFLGPKVIRWIPSI